VSTWSVVPGQHVASKYVSSSEENMPSTATEAVLAFAGRYAAILWAATKDMNKATKALGASCRGIHGEPSVVKMALIMKKNLLVALIFHVAVLAKIL